MTKKVLTIPAIFMLAVCIVVSATSSVDKMGANTSNNEVSERNALGLDPTAFPKVTTSVFVNNNCASSGGLREQDFGLMENGSKVDIDSFFFTGQASGQRLDLAVVFDDTSSLAPNIEILKSKVQDLIYQIAESGLDARYALVSFKDHENMRLSWTKDTASFRSGVNSLNVSSGDDFPENALDAIEATLDLGFRPDAQKMILVITDAPAHQKGDGTTITGLTGDNVKADLLKSGTIFIVVSPDFTSDFAPYLDLRNLANEVGETWINIASADFAYILDHISSIITGMYVIKYTSPDLSYNTPRKIQVSFRS
jgi:hypothetical protein